MQKVALFLLKSRLSTTYLKSGKKGRLGLTILWVYYLLKIKK